MRKHRKSQHYSELQQMLKMSSTIDFTYSVNLFHKTRDSIVLRKFFRVFFNATFNSETVFGFKDEAFKKALCIVPQT